ncbi:MAG: glycosyltransferase [Acidimicrobiia bacterium]
MFALHDEAHGRRVGMVSTYPPTRCGIARFAERLSAAITSLRPGWDLDVVRLIDRQGPSAIGKVRAEIDPDSPISLRSAARVLDRTDLVIVQHEYGIFGRNDGESVIELVNRVHQPVATILHTVRVDPSHRQRKIIQQLDESSSLIVMCETAREVLRTRYDISAENVTVIHHGSDWTAQPPNPAPRRHIISWGLLGPGKGLERALRAIALLGDMSPRPHYSIVGRTHPNVLRHSGTAYRESLEHLVAELGIEHMVTFVDRYLDEDELLAMVANCDVALVPYDNQEQMSSGVVTDALAAGRPVVATQFPYAVEMLADGSGVTTDRSVDQVAQAIESLLTDDAAYLRAFRAAQARSQTLSWTSAAQQLLDTTLHPISRTHLEVR